MVTASLRDKSTISSETLSKPHSPNKKAREVRFCLKIIQATWCGSQSLMCQGHWGSIWEVLPDHRNTILLHGIICMPAFSGSALHKSFPKTVVTTSILPFSHCFSSLCTATYTTLFCSLLESIWPPPSPETMPSLTCHGPPPGFLQHSLVKSGHRHA